MRRNARVFPALSAASILAASAVALSGCCTAPADLHRHPKLTSAFVMFDGTKAELTHFPSLPDKKLAQVSVKNQDTIMWCSPYGRVHIVKWSPRRPFAKDPVYEDGCLKSGPPLPGTEGTTFVYDAELWLSSDPDGTKPIRIDPRIEVME